jgi:hypothetical protein
MRRRLVVVGVLICVLAFVAAVVFVPGAGAQGPGRVARLTGAQEVPGPGDGNGTGTAVIRLRPDVRRICFDLQWRRIGAPTQAHIHRAPRGVEGPIAVTLFESATPLPRSIRRVEGCVGALPRALVRNIRDNPSQFYVNIHNQAFPDGAIRGQLRHP